MQTPPPQAVPLLYKQRRSWSTAKPGGSFICVAWVADNTRCQNGNVGAGSARPRLYRVLVIPTKRSAEGSLSLFLARAGGPRPYSCLVFFLFSFCHVLLLRKSTKTPGTRKKQSGGSLLTSRMRHSSVEPPLPLQPLRLLQGAAELILLIDNACSKWSRVAQT